MALGTLELTRRKELETEINSMGRTWNELQEVASDRQAWLQLVEGLCGMTGKVGIPPLPMMCPAGKGGKEVFTSLVGDSPPPPIS